MLIKPISVINRKPNFNNKYNNFNRNISFRGIDCPCDEVTISTKIKNPVRRYEKTFDSFTGLRDKNYLINVLKDKIIESQKEKKNLSIAIFDMDNFKSINEVLGYKTGDEFIKAISGNIKEIAQENSIGAYRFGGEEFVLVFDGQPVEFQNEIADKVLKAISTDERIQNRAGDYKRIATNLLNYYKTFQSRVDEIAYLKNKQKYLKDLEENFTTNAARLDPYFQHSLLKVNAGIRTLNMELIRERLLKEENQEIFKNMLDIFHKFNRSEELTNKEKNWLDNYLWEQYDRSYQIHQVTKWLSDFENNDGFSISGGVIQFRPTSLSNKTPIDIVNDAGELLKKAKRNKKGERYSDIYTEV